MGVRVVDALSMFLVRFWFNTVTAPLWVPPWLAMAGMKYLAENTPYWEEDPLA